MRTQVRGGVWHGLNENSANIGSNSACVTTALTALEPRTARCNVNTHTGLQRSKTLPQHIATQYNMQGVVHHVTTQSNALQPCCALQYREPLGL